MPDAPARKTRLRGLRVTRVDLVDAGDNPDAHIVLAKARPTGGPDVPDLPDNLAHLAPLADVSPDDLAAIGEFVTATFKEHEAAAAYLDAHRAEADALRKERDDALAAVEKVRKGEPLPDADPVFKDLPAEARERIEKAEAASKAAEERVEKMEREARVAKARVDAAATMKRLGDPEQVADLLVQVEDALPEVAKTLRSIFTAADERIAKGALFAEVGRTAADPASAQGRLDAKADEFQKADPDLTRPQAITKAMEADPSLYEEVQAEQSA